MHNDVNLMNLVLINFKAVFCVSFTRNLWRHHNNTWLEMRLRVQVVFGKVWCGPKLVQ